MSDLTKDERVCKCGLRTRLVGDGCEVCNPAQTIEYLKEQVAALERDLLLANDAATKGDEARAILAGMQIDSAHERVFQIAHEMMNAGRYQDAAAIGEFLVAVNRASHEPEDFRVALERIAAFYPHGALSAADALVVARTVLAKYPRSSPETKESLSTRKGGEKSEGLHSDHRGLSQARSSECGIVRGVPGESIQSREPEDANDIPAARASTEQLQAMCVDPAQSISQNTGDHRDT